MTDAHYLTHWVEAYETEDIGNTAVMHVETKDGRVTLGRDWLDWSEEAEWEVVLRELLKRDFSGGFPHSIPVDQAVSTIKQKGLVRATGQNAEKRANALLGVLASESILGLENGKIIIPDVPEDDTPVTEVDLMATAVYFDTMSAKTQKVAKLQREKLEEIKNTLNNGNIQETDDVIGKSAEHLLSLLQIYDDTLKMRANQMAQASHNHHAYAITKEPIPEGPDTEELLETMDDSISKFATGAEAYLDNTDMGIEDVMDEHAIDPDDLIFGNQDGEEETEETDREQS